MSLTELKKGWNPAWIRTFPIFYPNDHLIFLFSQFYIFQLGILNEKLWLLCLAMLYLVLCYHLHQFCPGYNLLGLVYYVKISLKILAIRICRFHKSRGHKESLRKGSILFLSFLKICQVQCILYICLWKKDLNAVSDLINTISNL